MAAQLQIPQQQSYAQNLAPLKPLLELKSGGRKPASYIAKAIKERFDHFQRKDRDIFREIFNVGQLVSLFLNGKQFLVRSPIDGSWGILPLKGSNTDQRALNILNNIKTNLLGKWENSSPDIVIRPGRNLDTCISAAKAADTVNNYYERQFYDHWFTQQECLMGMTFGTYIDRYRYDVDKCSMSVVQEVFETTNAQFGSGFGYCADCEYVGNDSEFKPSLGGEAMIAQPKCPQCRSTAVEVLDAPAGQLSNAVGKRQQSHGDLVCELLPVPACRWDLARRPEDSSWFIYNQEIPLGSVQRILGNVLLPADDLQSDTGLEVLRALQKQGQPLGGYALKFDTPIITPDGWKEIWELRTGDQVFSDDGKPCNVTWTSGLMLNRSCYEVEFSDGSVITADEDHLWHTYTHRERGSALRSSTEWRLRRSRKRKKEWKAQGLWSSPTMAFHNLKKVFKTINPSGGKVRSTSEIANSLLIGQKKPRYNHAVIKPLPLEYPENHLPIDPYVLGAWLGDGAANGTAITIGPKDIDAMRDVFKGAGIDLIKRGKDNYSYGLAAPKASCVKNARGQFTVDSNSLLARLRSLNLLGNKHIPDIYLRSSVTQRLALLQGLMDTDGSPDPIKGTSEFTNCNAVLCDGFAQLISSLGIRGHYGYRVEGSMVSPFNGKRYIARPQYRIGFRSELPLYRLPRKLAKQKREFKHDPKWLRIVSVRPVESVPVCCISIDAPSRCYLAGKTMVPTHNSAYGNRRERRTGEKADTCTFNEMWLSPDDYADITLIGDEETVDGERLPKGKLTDVFPDGLCAVGLNGMSVVLALYPERHKSHIVSGTWFMQAQTGAGRGIVDSVEIQKIFNTMNNQALQYMTSTYTPAIGYDQSIWSGSRVKYIGTPRTNIPFDLTKLPEGRKLADSIYQFQPTAMPSQFFNFAQNFMSILMQKTSMVTDFANGEPGITAQNTTATAAEIDQGNADAINQPIFLIKADARRRAAEITIRLFREHFPMKRYFDLGGEYGEQEGVELAASDVEADLIYGVVPNSEMPQGPYTRRKNRMQFFNAVGGFEGLLMANQSAPKMLAATARDFDVDIELNQNYDAVAIICRKRLNQMTEAAKLGVNDPAILLEAIQPPISPVEPDLADSGKWYANWLRTDQGQNAPMPLRLAIELLTRTLISGQVAQEAELAAGQGQVAAAQMAAPAIGQAMLEQQAQQSPESTEPDPTALVQMEQEREQQEHEAREGALDREHELKVIEAEGKRDKDVARTDATEKIRLERAKPKPKPASKGTKKK